MGWKEIARSIGIATLRRLTTQTTNRTMLIVVGLIIGILLIWQNAQLRSIKQQLNQVAESPAKGDPQGTEDKEDSGIQKARNISNELENWTVSFDEELDDSTYLVLKYNETKKPIVLDKELVSILLKKLFGGTTDLFVDRFSIVEIDNEEKKENLLLDRYLGNVWKYEASGNFKILDVERVSDLNSPNTQFGELIDRIVDATGGFIIHKKKPKE